MKEIALRYNLLLALLVLVFPAKVYAEDKGHQANHFLDWKCGDWSKENSKYMGSILRAMTDPSVPKEEQDALVDASPAAIARRAFLSELDGYSEDEHEKKFALLTLMNCRSDISVEDAFKLSAFQMGLIAEAPALKLDEIDIEKNSCSDLLAAAKIFDKSPLKQGNSPIYTVLESYLLERIGSEIGFEKLLMFSSAFILECSLNAHVKLSIVLEKSSSAAGVGN